jgi:putative Holliday junction resolvase
MPIMSAPPLTRILAIDLGDKRIGVALSDPTKTLAAGYDVIRRTSRQSDYEAIGKIVSENDVVLIVVGLPTLPSGEEGTRAAWARDYSSALAKALGIKVELWDESLTTADATDSLRQRGYGKNRRRKRVDAVAAAFILQSYIESNKLSELGLDDEEY